jgi:isopenicillin N synthase-like dioxygenase
VIPIIDLSIIRQYPNDAKLVQDLNEALIHSGFCYLKNHGISKELIERAQSSSLHFFARSEKYKKKFSIANAIRHSGYVSFDDSGLYSDEAIRLYEAYDISKELPASDVDFLSGNIFYGPNTWPDSPDFKSDVYAYYEAVSELSILITHTLETALELRTNSLTNMMKKPTAQLRMIHYPENEIRCRDVASHTMMGAHTDYEFFTLLYQTMPGLQTVNVVGDWVDVPPIEDTLVMNVGDMAEVISGGRYRSNPHRVLNNGKERFSMPFFAAFDYNTTIYPMVSNINSNANANNVYASINAGEHLLKHVTLDFSYLRERKAVANPSLHFAKMVNNPFFKGKSPWIN